MYYETDKKMFVSKKSDKRSNVICVLKVMVDAAGLSFCCSFCSAAAEMALAATTTTIPAAAADANPSKRQLF